MQLTLTGRAEEIVQLAVARGEYPNAEQMMEDAVVFLQGFHSAEFQLGREAESRIEEGIAQAERCEVIHAYDGLNSLRGKMLREA
jgi:hypothetical protein